MVDNTRLNEHRILRLKYASAYFSAISKLSASDRYDELGYIKPDYELTAEEKAALICYVNGNEKQIKGRNR